jgi:predicted unusual protein kinase regulating ubiquinone biosynthesis (AarF/ABC1/UbiB family)
MSSATEKVETQSRASRVPSTRIERLFHVGVAAGGMAASALFGGARKLASGEVPELQELLFTPDNAVALANRLSRMRGAAMKLGQLISLEGGAILPPAFSEALAILGASADTMTDRQLRRVLEREYGRAWEDRFTWFDESPMASASIGQVHRARSRDGRELALKVQFPGVAEGIEGDVENLGSLLRVSGLIPAKFDLTPLIAEVRRQLMQETDYRREAESLSRYRELVADESGVRLPIPHFDLTTDRVLAMEYVPARPIKYLWEEAHTPEQRDRIGGLLQRLVLRELFEFRFMQSDPNYANFEYDSETGQLVLLDFGSMVEISAELSDRYRFLIRAAVAEDVERIEQHLLDFGWVDTEDAPAQRRGLAEFILLAAEPLRSSEPYDYGGSDLAARVQSIGMELTFDEGLRRPPPPELVFIHRKLAGIYLLCARLGARVPTAGMVEEFLG